MDFFILRLYFFYENQKKRKIGKKTQNPYIENVKLLRKNYYEETC